MFHQPPEEVATAVAATAVDLAADMVRALGPNATLEQRAERERFVADVMMSARGASPRHGSPDREDVLTGSALYALSRWQDVRSAAAWQLLIAARELGRFGSPAPAED